MKKVYELFFFNEKVPKGKYSSFLMPSLTPLLIIYSIVHRTVNIYKYLFLVVAALWASTSVIVIILLENQVFFNEGDRKKRFIIARSLQVITSIIVFIIVISWIYFW